MADRPFRFGLQIVEFDDPDDVRTAARQAEQLGYDELFTADHVGAPDPFVPLVVAAEATTGLRVGPLVLNNELHHPALLARTAATVDRHSGGRLVLGLGTGYMRSEHEATAIPLRPPGERVDRLEESVVALRTLLDTGHADLDGSHHTLAIADLGIRPASEHVPLLLGGHGRRVVGVAARHADVFQFTGLTHGADGTPGPGGFPPEEVERRHRWLVEGAADRVDDIELSALVQMTHVGDGADAVIDVAAQRSGLAADLLDQTPFLLLGSLEQVVDQVGRMREQYGISHWVVRDSEGFAPVVEALAGH